MVEGASGDRSMQTAQSAVWYDAEGGRRRDYVTVMLGLSLFVTNLSPRGCWRAVGTQCEPVGSEYEPARSDSVTECEPGKGDVCKPACGYLRAATRRHPSHLCHLGHRPGCRAPAGPQRGAHDPACEGPRQPQSL